MSEASLHTEDTNDWITLISNTCSCTGRTTVHLLRNNFSSWLIHVYWAFGDVSESKVRCLCSRWWTNMLLTHCSPVIHRNKMQQDTLHDCFFFFSGLFVLFPNHAVILTVRELSPAHPISFKNSLSSFIIIITIFCAASVSGMFSLFLGSLCPRAWNRSAVCPVCARSWISSEIQTRSCCSPSTSNSEVFLLTSDVFFLNIWLNSDPKLYLCCCLYSESEIWRKSKPTILEYFFGKSWQRPFTDCLSIPFLWKQHCSNCR